MGRSHFLLGGAKHPPKRKCVSPQDPLTLVQYTLRKHFLLFVGLNKRKFQMTPDCFEIIFFIPTNPFFLRLSSLFGKNVLNYQIKFCLTLLKFLKMYAIQTLCGYTFHVLSFLSKRKSLGRTKRDLMRAKRASAQQELE